MKRLRIGRKKLLLAGVVILLLAGVITAAVLIRDNRKAKEAEANTQAQLDHNRTDYSPQEIADLAPTPEYAFSRLYTTADVAKRQGDMVKAEAYLVEAVNQAKLTNDQTTINNAYGMLIRFYQSQDNQAKLVEIKAVLGEGKYGELTALPPADEVPFR